MISETPLGSLEQPEWPWEDTRQQERSGKRSKNSLQERFPEYVTFQKGKNSHNDQRASEPDRTRNNSWVYGVADTLRIATNPTYAHQVGVT